VSRNGKANFQQLKKLQKEMQRFKRDELDAFAESAAKELAARLLAKVIKRTPVGQYPDVPGKVGGTLRRGWTGGKKASGKSYAESLKIHTFGDTYVVEIINPVQYSSYVEFGHRTRNNKGWVRGRFMMTISANEIEREAPAILERKLKKKLGELFD